MSATFTAFVDQTCVGQGSLLDVARAVAARPHAGPPLLIFDDLTGEQIELDLRAGPDVAVAEFLRRTAPPEAEPATRGRGRPRLGVVAREVTLLPRHWDWLSSQPGGASAALRRLVETARREAEGPDHARRIRDALYRVMSVLAGDLSGYEEASRALFAGDAARLDALTASWPADIRTYLRRLSSDQAEPRRQP